MLTNLEYIYRTPHGTYEVFLEKSQYPNKRTALMLVDKHGERVAVATVNLPAVQLAFDEACIKTWSENALMLDFLIKNNIVEDTGREVPAGYAYARIVRLLV
jgi:hypothetical protein